MKQALNVFLFAVLLGMALSCLLVGKSTIPLGIVCLLTSYFFFFEITSEAKRKAEKERKKDRT